MSTLAFQAPETEEKFDDFAALEKRVLRAVELLQSERAARSAAETRVAELLRQLEAKTAKLEEASAELTRADGEMDAFKQERGAVRSRIERLLEQLDGLSV